MESGASEWFAHQSEAPGVNRALAWSRKHRARHLRVSETPTAAQLPTHLKLNVWMRWT